jgi:hypothetical protein
VGLLASIVASDTVALAFEAFLGFEVLGCFRPAFLRAALGLRAILGLSAGSALRTAQIRVTATSRDSNFLTGLTPGRPFVVGCDFRQGLIVRPFGKGGLRFEFHRVPPPVGGDT